MARNQDSSSVKIGRVNVNRLSMNSLMKRLDSFVDGDEHHYVCFCEANLWTRANRNPDVRKILDEASLVLPDGISMTGGARLLGEKMPDRLPGPQVMLEYCRHGVSEGRRHFFYGGEDGVADSLADTLRGDIPGLQVAGTYSPPFRELTPGEKRDVKSRIEDSGADVIWVGLGAPKQERWMARNHGRIDVPLMLGVGAAFDFHTGNRAWAPACLRAVGLEWAWRMVTGGTRVFWRNGKVVPYFAFRIAWEAIKSRIHSSDGKAAPGE